MPTAAAKETAIVTKAELTEIAKLEIDYAKAKKKVSDTEKDLKFQRIRLAEKVLGVKSEDELKALSPDQVAKRLEKRLETGDWKPERGAPEFQFVKSSSGSYPAWRQLFVENMGETAAARIAAETDVTYSYRVEVTL
jgi:hypothetical protein